MEKIYADWISQSLSAAGYLYSGRRAEGVRRKGVSVWIEGCVRGEYCCHKYHVYSADIEDLQHWTDHGPVLASTDEYADEGITDGVPWSDGLLWAPDVVERTAGIICISVFQTAPRAWRGAGSLTVPSRMPDRSL